MQLTYRASENSSHLRKNDIVSYAGYARKHGKGIRDDDIRSRVRISARFCGLGGSSVLHGLGVWGFRLMIGFGVSVSGELMRTFPPPLRVWGLGMSSVHVACALTGLKGLGPFRA